MLQFVILHASILSKVCPSSIKCMTVSHHDSQSEQYASSYLSEYSSPSYFRVKKSSNRISTDSESILLKIAMAMSLAKTKYRSSLPPSYVLGRPFENSS